MISDIVRRISAALWGAPMLMLILGYGVYMSFRLRLFQLTHIRLWLCNTFFSLFKKGNKEESGLSSLGTIASALGATIGTGNIIGVATAISFGGPGAVFWMWVSAVFGMMTKYAEILLAVKYRRIRGHGFVGGPMYYIEDGLGKKYKWLAVLFCISGAGACFGMGGMSQSNSISTVMSNGLNINPIITGAVLMAISLKSSERGLSSIARISAILVPIAAALYIGLGVWTIAADFDAAKGALYDVFLCAFRPRAVYGAAAGESVRLMLRYGFARGTFSNEAGMGSSPMLHATAKTKSPAEQGLWGMFEVFADTFVICSISAIMIISSGAYALGNNGVDIIEITFFRIFGRFGKMLSDIIMVLFALTTIIGWSYYGERCVLYLSNENQRVKRFFGIAFSAAVFFGAITDSGLAWELSDLLNGLMMLPNITALFMLSSVVIKETKKELKI